MALNEVSTSDIIEVKGGTLTVTTKTTTAIQDMNFKPDPELVGRPIRSTLAAEKYGVQRNTISRWAYDGLIGILEQAPKKLILDEADVAKATSIYKLACKRTGSTRKAGWILRATLEQQLAG